MHIVNMHKKARENWVDKHHKQAERFLKKQQRIATQTGKVNEYAINYDEKTNHWLFVYQKPNGKYRTMVFSKNQIEYDTDTILYHAQPISNIDFWGNTIYDPDDGKIIGTNLAKNTAKEFPCKVVDESCKLKFTGRGFKIYGKDHIYQYG